jgi:hypothetical protein
MLSAIVRRLAERQFFLELAGWAKDFRVTSRQFHKAVLRVFVFLQVGARLIVLARKNVLDLILKF